MGLLSILKNYSGFLLISGAVVLLASCNRSPQPERIVLPATPVLSMRSEWGVVTSDVLRIRKNPSIEAGNTLTFVKKGTILEILNKSVKKEQIEERLDSWYQVNYEGLRGWLFGAYIEIVESKAKAADLSEELMK